MRTGSKLPNPSKLCPSKLISSFNYHWHDFQTVAYCKIMMPNSQQSVFTQLHIFLSTVSTLYLDLEIITVVLTLKKPSVDPILLYTDQESVGQLGEKMGTISVTSHIYNLYWLCKTHYYMRFTEQSNNLESNQEIIQP